MGIEITCLRAGGLSIIPESPPVVWQAWTEQGWYEVDVEEDGTGGMSWSGQILMHLPEMAQREVNGVPAYWVRCELVTPKEDQLPYETSPELTNVGAATWGATVEAHHATEVVNEPLGRSDGSPGQIFHLQQTPVLPRQEDERLEIWGPGMEDWEAWTEVPELNYSGSNDKHYTLDSSTGELRLGPALRLRDGSVQRYGAIPPRGAEVRFSRYRYGGGTAGNVRRGSLNELRTALAYIDHVANREDAIGGLDQETLDHAMFRAQALLRTRFRAVTAADYEYLTLHRFPEIARVLCLQTRLAGRRAGALSPGRVYVIVVPGLPEEEARRYIPLSRLTIPDELRERINAYLNERRPLTAQLEARAAGYRRVRAEVVVIGEPGVDERQLARDIITALELLINPLVGGPNGTGWPFGRELYLSDLYACVQQVKGLRYVHEVRMGWVDESETLHPVERKIELLAHEVLVSDRHQVRVEFE
jgi:predicted phage baseplate assembly protein